MLLPIKSNARAVAVALLLLFTAVNLSILYNNREEKRALLQKLALKDIRVRIKSTIFPRDYLDLYGQNLQEKVTQVRCVSYSVANEFVCPNLPILNLFLKSSTRSNSIQGLTLFLGDKQFNPQKNLEPANIDDRQFYLLLDRKPDRGYFYERLLWGNNIPLNGANLSNILLTLPILLYDFFLREIVLIAILFFLWKLKNIRDAKNKII